LDAVLKATEIQPDLILMDINLPKLNGIGAAQQILKSSPKSKILFLSLNLDPDVVRATFSVGGHGYVVKSDAESELIVAVEAVMLGKRFVSSRNSGLGSLEADNESVAPPTRQRKTADHRHEVQFYANDASFLERFTGFAKAALEVGNAVIVIATSSHRESLRQRLRSYGSDFADAIERGCFVALEPADVLSTFMVNDLPDPSRFRKVAADLIVNALKAVKGGHPRVAACGECAPLLYAEGHADAAIRLEQLWNEVARTYNVDILCGYPLEIFRGEENSPVFQRICAEHSAIHSQ
jgi:CheY-like chemotaxis protein